METKHYNILKLIKIINVALLLWLIHFSDINLQIVSSKLFTTIINTGFEPLFLLVVLWIFCWSHFFYIHQIKRIIPRHSITINLYHYPTANFKNYTWAAGTVLLSIVFAYLTLTCLILLISFVFILILVYHFPFKEKSSLDLPLSNDKQLLLRYSKVTISVLPSSLNKNFR